MTVSLEEIPELEDYLYLLKPLGYTTLEQLLGAARVSQKEISAYLGIQSNQLSDLANSLVSRASAIPASDRTVIENAIYPLGVAVGRISPPTTAFSLPIPPASTLPAQVNHIPNLPPIRNQASRGTCVAFASLSSFEHYLKVNGPGLDLSEQFLYWNCKRNDGIPNEEGTYVGIAFPLLEREGCCQEEKWPYKEDPEPNNEGQGPPPGGALIEALRFRIPGYKQLSPTAVQDIKTVLVANRCVTVSIPVFYSWYANSAVRYSGDITLPFPNEVRDGGHAICLVGYIDDPDGQVYGGGRFIVRNSWGQDWGIKCTYGKGYGTIPYNYLTRHGLEAFSID